MIVLHWLQVCISFRLLIYIEGLLPRRSELFIKDNAELLKCISFCVSCIGKESDSLEFFY